MVVICAITFNTQTFYSLATECVYVFCMDIRKNSALFPYVALSDCFFFIIAKNSLLRSPKWTFKYNEVNFRI